MLTAVANTAIKNGLPSNGAEIRPEIFTYNGDLFMICGRVNGNIISYKWNAGSSIWEANTLFEAFDTNPGTRQLPTVFYYNSNLYLISSDNNTSTFNGYLWNSANSRWEVNAAIKTGLSSAVTDNCPTVFEMGGEMFLISGKNDGLFNGFKWNGTQWTAYSAIISGLTDVGTYSRPEHLLFESEHYIIHGGSFAWKWNGSLQLWETNTLVSGTPSPTGKLTSLYLNGVCYLIAGLVGGSFLGYVIQSNAKISSVLMGNDANAKATLVVNLSAKLDDDDILTAYSAPSAGELGNASYLVPLTKINDTTYEYVTNIPEGQYCYFRAVQTWHTLMIKTTDKTGQFYILPSMSATTLNITDANNYRILNNPVHGYNHGSLFLNGFIYGSARNTPTGGLGDIFKIEAANYSNIIQKTIYQNKTGSLNRIQTFDQIVYCSGFLWLHFGQYLIRVNPSDLDYMVFSGLPICNQNEPPATDGTYLYLGSALSVTKIDTSQLIGSFASYGYTGNAAVSVTPSAILQSCALINYHPTEKAWIHSAVTDNNYLYLNCSTVGATFINGYDSALNINFCHLQKIRKSDMTTVGDVVIPKSTDDVTQSGEYLILGPELTSLAHLNQLGKSWGLFAVNKSTLEIKYLKNLHPRTGIDSGNQACFGVFFINNKIIVQLNALKETIVVDISNIENWGIGFPIGGATEAIYKFQLNGVNFATPCNEINIDNTGWVHTNTWEQNTMVFKFPLSLITTAVKTPNIQTSLISTSENSATLNGYIIDEGQSPITVAGFKYGTDPESLINDLPADPFSYDFTEALNSLGAGVYYFKAYGVNTQGTFYGNTVMCSIVSQYNAVSLHNNDSVALLEFVNAHFGCSIRCCQDAPGIATGTTGTVQDQDGNSYDTVVINEKRWMVQNLKTTKFRNGDLIPNITDAEAWELDESGAYCAYENKPSLI